MSQVRRLAHAYNINVEELTPRKGAFQALLRGGGSLCVKQMKLPRQEVKFIVRSLQHLRDAGYSYSPKLLYTKRAQPWLRQHEVRYVLTNWVDGKSPDFSHVSQLRKAVKTLAEFHKYAQGLKMTNVPETRMPISHLDEHIKSSSKFIEQRVPSEQALPFIEMCTVAMDYLKRPNTQRAIRHELRAKAFVHGDYNYHNIMIDSTGHYQLIDFDKTALQARMYDLAHLMYRVCPWNGDDAARLIEVYDRIRPITQADLCLFVTFRCIPGSLIRSIHWGGNLDLPSPEKIRRHMKWLRNTCG